MTRKARLVVVSLIAFGIARTCWAVPPPVLDDTIEPTKEVIYGRRDGMALTILVYMPQVEQSGIGLLWIGSGGYNSSYEITKRTQSWGVLDIFLKKGITVFAVLHCSQPKYTPPDMLEDVHRSVRYVRTHATEYGVDPKKLCATGPSAGGSLSLLLATTGRDGDPSAKDPVERTSSRLQAVACLIGPTDYLNYGSQGVNALGVGPLSFAKGPFDFVRFNKKLGVYEKVTDEDEIRELGKAISPVYHISSDDPPALLVHGTEDRIVPLQQAKIAVEKFKAVDVEATLNAMEGRGHSVGMDGYRFTADWLNKTLK